MNNHNAHENHEAHKIGGELRHHEISEARKELRKEAHHPAEFKKMVEKLNHDLKAHHQNPLAVQHDKHGNISHLHFGKHDIYDKEHASAHHAHGEHQHEHSKHSSQHERHKGHHKTGTPGGRPEGSPPAPAGETPPAAENKPETPEEFAKKNGDMATKLDPKIQEPARKLLEEMAKHGSTSSELDAVRKRVEGLSATPGITTDAEIAAINQMTANLHKSQ